MRTGRLLAQEDMTIVHRAGSTMGLVETFSCIACAPISTFNGTSKVYLWNLTSTDVQEVIDWGEGELRVLETIEGMLVGLIVA